MTESTEPFDNPKVRLEEGIGTFLYAAVTRRDRAPGALDEAYEWAALHLEELSATLCSRMPASPNVVSEDCHSAAFLALMVESLGIVRQRSPDSYEALMAALVIRDPRNAPLREALFAMVRPDKEAFTELVERTLEPMLRKLARDRSRLRFMTLAAAAVIALLIALTVPSLVEPSSNAYMTERALPLPAPYPLPASPIWIPRHQPYQPAHPLG